MHMQGLPVFVADVPLFVGRFSHILVAFDARVALCLCSYQPFPLSLCVCVCMYVFAESIPEAITVPLYF